jgi:hypothetical protein
MAVAHVDDALLRCIIISGRMSESGHLLIQRSHICFRRVRT